MEDDKKQTHILKRNKLEKRRYVFTILCSRLGSPRSCKEYRGPLLRKEIKPKNKQSQRNSQLEGPAALTSPAPTHACTKQAEHVRDHHRHYTGHPGLEEHAKNS